MIRPAERVVISAEKDCVDLISSKNLEESGNCPTTPSVLLSKHSFCGGTNASPLSAYS